MSLPPIVPNRGGEVASHVVAAAPSPPTIELFRGGEVLKVVPFYPTDDAGYLDVALPDAKQNVEADSRPADLGADFPKKDFYGDNDKANADPGVFRLRLKDAPDAFDGSVTLKVLDSNGQAIDKISEDAKVKDTATYKNGMAVVLKRKGDVWESPYMRVATNPIKSEYTIVHSLPPLGSDNMDAGKQFGRKLRISGSAGGSPFEKDFTLGGQPFARIPVKFFFVADRVPSHSIMTQTIRNARDKIHNLNQFWAAQGLEFRLVDSSTPLHQVPAPPRTLITIGDYTGKTKVSDHDFTVRISLSVKVGDNDAEAVNIVANVGANKNPIEAANVIKDAIKAWTPADHGTLAGLELDADTFDIAQARAYLTPVPLNLSGGAPNSGPLQLLGARGPADVVIKKKAGNRVALADLRITGIRVFSSTDDPDTSIDINTPPMKEAYHDAVMIPPAGTTRHWVRTFSPADKTFVSVVVEHDPAHVRRATDGYPHKLCQQNFCSLFHATEGTMKVRFAPPLNGDVGRSGSPAVTLLNFGLWDDPSAKFILFMASSKFRSTQNDLQHEMGHALADLDHTIEDPTWFYTRSLMRRMGQPEIAISMTNHKVYVDYIKDDDGWKFSYKALEHGYGGAVRARIKANMSDWLVNELDDGQPDW